MMGTYYSRADKQVSCGSAEFNSSPGGCWREEGVETKRAQQGKGFWQSRMSCELQPCQWPSPDQDSLRKHQEARVPFVPSPPGPDTDTWWGQVWTHQHSTRTGA